MPRDLTSGRSTSVLPRHRNEHDRGDVASTLINAVRVALGTHAGSRAKTATGSLDRSGCTPRLPAEVSGKPICLPSCPGDHGPDHTHQPGLTAVAPTNAEEVSSCFLGSVRHVRIYQHDVQVPGTVHALDAAELDVAGGAGSGDPGLRAGRVEPGVCIGASTIWSARTTQTWTSGTRVRTRRPSSPTTGYPAECPCRSPAYQAAGQRSARTSAKSGRAWHAHDRTICLGFRRPLLRRSPDHRGTTGRGTASGSPMRRHRPAQDQGFRATPAQR